MIGAIAFLCDRLGWRPGRCNGAQPNDERLAPVTVITGGTEGIGRSLAHEFAKSGYNLLLIARNRVLLAEQKKEIETLYDVSVSILDTDLADTGSCAVVERAVHAWKLYPQFLINNAAAGLAGPFQTHDEDALLHLIDLNVRTLTALTRWALPGMTARGRGGILNVASLGGFVPGPHQAAYYASNAFVISLTRAIAHESAGTGVRVAVLAPGVVNTKFHQKMGAEGAYYLKIFPGMCPQSVARTAYYIFMLRLQLIVPGVINLFNFLMLRLLPYFVTVPVMGWLLKQRNNDNID